jgi:acetate kinase
MKMGTVLNNHNNLLNEIIPMNNYKIELVSNTHKQRSEINHFIHAAYIRHFSAHLKTFFPLILTIKAIDTNETIAAVGIRYAKSENLFSECYLEESIEQTIATLESKPTTRNKVAELGNFVVKKQSDIKVVIPILGQFIKKLDVDWVVYTLTRPIRHYFNKLDIEVNYISDANISKVNGAAKNWGRYYNYKPAVYYSSVNKNLNNPSK